MAGVPITPGSGATVAFDKVGTASAPTTDERIQYVKPDFGAAGSSSPVTVSNPLPVGQKIDWIQVTLSLDTSAYASGDLLADAQAITSAALASGGAVELVSLLCVDEDDQKVAFDIYITSDSTSWGTENSAPTITDAAARSIQAIVPIAAADWKDLGGVAVAQPRIAQSIGVICETSGSANLYVAVVNGSGTPTFSASGVRINFGFRQTAVS
jgi:hypothetical protein